MDFELINQRLSRSQKGNYYISHRTKEKQPIYFIDLDDFDYVIPNVDLPRKINNLGSFFIMAGPYILFDFIDEVSLEDLVNYKIEDDVLSVEINNVEEFKERLNKKISNAVISFPENPFNNTKPRDIKAPKNILFGFLEITEDEGKLDYWSSLSVIEKLKLKED